MSTILKHILRNIKSKKGRSLLIVLALTIATTVFVLNLTLPDEIVLKLQETFRSVYGNVDINVQGVEPFVVEDLKLNDEKINYVGISTIEAIVGDKPVIIYGMDIQKGQEIKMLGQDIPNLNKNEIVIGQEQAEEFGFKEGEDIQLVVGENTYQFKLVKIIKEEGITSLQVDNPLFISNIETINEIMQIETKKYDALFIDVENDEKVSEYVQYIEDNNENFLTQELVNIENIKEQIKSISYIIVLICAISTIMIFFVVSSLNRIIIAERMPVIGTFRSIGATKSKMNLILIFENIVYGIIGGILGCLAGYQINSKVASLFITTSGVELSSQTSQMTVGVMIIGIVFAILLELFISVGAILKVSKKPIKDIIFDVQSTRYKIKKKTVIYGVILILAALIINYINKQANFLLAIVSIIFLFMGIANIVPIIIRGFSIILATICKKIGWATGVIASRNIGYNKMIISSSRLIVIAISAVLAILSVSNSFAKVFESFRHIYDFDIMVANVSESAEEYEYLKDINEVTDIEYLYYFYDNETIYNGDKKFSITPIIIGLDKKEPSIQEINYKVEDLKYDELLVDEKLAEKNNINLNDKIKIKLGTLNKEFEFTVVGFTNSAYFSSSRNVIVVNLQNYKDNITNVPVWLEITAKDGADLESLKQIIKDQVKEIGIDVKTFEEYISEQEESTAAIMSMFYVIVGLAMILSFIGIVNNQIIGFMQRKREIAILNSTCMSKLQLKKMLIIETILTNLISCTSAIIIGFLMAGITGTALESMQMFVEVLFNWNLTFKFVGMIFVVLLLTLILPIKRLKKINIVDEIKYE